MSTAGSRTAPTLSVVVPIYNVEPYLAECLQSITDQHLEDIEVIMVDDGSTDASPTIAAGWIERDHRFVLVSQSNQGLGAARNKGAHLASGRYLAFIDSDDIAPRDAYTIMVSTLEETGSDIATGNVQRFDAYRTWQAPIAAGIFDRERLETHVSEYRELLRDLLAPNKVFRKEFWDREAVRFPEGVFYEDLPTIIPAHLKARKVDVVATVACLWRTRQQGEASITQNRFAESKHALDRVSAVRGVSGLMAAWPDPTLKVDYDTQALDRDIRYFVDVLPSVDEEYRRDAVPAIRDFVRTVSPQAMAKVSAVNRIKYHLLLEDRIDDLLGYVDSVRSGEVGREPLRVRRRSLHLDPPSLAHMRIPKAVSDVTDELRVVTRVDDIEMDGEVLRISGWAYINGLAASSPRSQQIRVWVAHLGPEERRHAVPVEAVLMPGATRRAGQPKNSYDWSGFRATLRLSDLKDENGDWSRGMWRFDVEVQHRHITRSAALRGPTQGRAQRTWMVQLDPGTEARVYWKQDLSELRVQTRRPQPSVEDVKFEDGWVQIGLQPSSEKAGAELVLIDAVEGREHRFPLREVEGLATASVPLDLLLSPLGADGTVPFQQFQILLERRGQSRRSRVVQHVPERTVALSSGSELTVRRNRHGFAVLLARRTTPRLVDATFGPDARLRLTVSFPVDGEFEVVLSAQGRSEQWSGRLHRTGGVLECEIPLGGRDVYGQTLPFRSGLWDVVIRGDDDRPLEIAATGLECLPQSVDVAGRMYRISDRAWHSVAVRVDGWAASGLSQGKYGQHQLQVRDYPRLRGTPVRQVAVFESYWGREFSDSPAVLQREIARRGLVGHCLAVVNDQQCQPDAGIEVVASGSPAYYEALATSRLVINNTHLPAYFERRPGQLVVQTWHGIGLKHVGLDIANVQFSNRNYADQVRAESKQWDYLISPNPFCSPILRRAFAYEGELLETGSPRNDVFHEPDGGERAREIRRRLGVEPSQSIVMYAPTWRDDVSDSSGRYRLDLRLDFGALSRRLGDGYALLFRKHPNIIDSLPADLRHSVKDVSQYPEVNDLLLVTDVLITDYSTLMFDFVNTRRPMIFYTYDLEHYRDTLRGFYFDFEAEAPGPLVESDAELPDLIESVDAWSQEYKQRYDRFVARFCAWDDGHAAERVVDTLESALSR